MKINKLGLSAVAVFVFTASTFAQSIRTKDTVFKSTGNPIIIHEYTADPAALVYKDRVYLYTGHDQAPLKRAGYEMHNWLCFSSSDMVNWTEHPSPLNVKD